MKETIVAKLHQELQGRELYKDIARAYGCTSAYVSRVLTGAAGYNQALIDIAIEILEKDKKAEAQALTATAKKLGVS